MMIKGPDGQMVECEIVSTRDKESTFSQNAPVLPLPLAIFCCVFNFVPGLGKKVVLHLTNLNLTAFVMVQKIAPKFKLQ